MMEADRRKKGIFIEDETWGQIVQAAKELKVAVPTA
jgi:hypothetical protein